MVGVYKSLCGIAAQKMQSYGFIRISPLKHAANIFVVSSSPLLYILQFMISYMSVLKHNMLHEFKKVTQMSSAMPLPQFIISLRVANKNCG